MVWLYVTGKTTSFMIAKHQSRFGKLERVIEVMGLYRLPQQGARLKSSMTKPLLVAMAIVIVLGVWSVRGPSGTSYSQSPVRQAPPALLMPLPIEEAVLQTAVPIEPEIVVARIPKRKPMTIREEFRQTFAAAGVPEELVCIVDVESAWNPRARSRTGAVGLFQLMPGTAARLNLRTRYPDERLNPRKSARAAARYLKKLHERFDDWSLALAAYNGGEERVQRLLYESRGKTFSDIYSRLPRETRSYVTRVQALAEEDAALGGGE